MESYDLILKNGKCAISDGTNVHIHETDIAIKNGKIAKIQRGISEPAHEIIYASHLHILPGIIDSQVHFREPGLTHKEDIESGTRSAALGGVTSIFEMPNTKPPTINAELFNEKVKIAEKKAYTNFAFYIGACAENIEELQNLEKLPHCSGVKVFMGSSTGNLLVDDTTLLEKILLKTKRRVIFHCEDEQRLKERKYFAEASGSPTSHPIWRDELTALNATQKIVNLAKKHSRQIHVLHVSSAEEMDFLKDYKQNATVEILPQFLTFSAPECYERIGTLAQMNPPIRDKRHMEFLWKAVRDGIVDIIATDHAPHTLEEKNKKYPQSPSGMTGVQTLVPVMLTHVNQKRLSLEKFVELTSQNVSRVFGMKNKGAIKVGYDADFTLVDMKKVKTIENKWITSKCGWTPYDGFKAHGWVSRTIINGQTIMVDDHLIARASGHGVLFD